MRRLQKNKMNKGKISLIMERKVLILKRRLRNKLKRKKMTNRVKRNNKKNKNHLKLKWMISRRI